MPRTDQPVIEGTDTGRDAAAAPRGDTDGLARRLAALGDSHPSGDGYADRTVRRADEPPRLTDAERAQHLAEVRETLATSHAGGLATDRFYTTDERRKIWTPERLERQEQVVNDSYAAAANVPCEGKAIMAGGLPGSGKTTVLTEQARIDLASYLMINPDKIIEVMAERGMVPDLAGLTPMEASDLVHEESSLIAQRLAMRAHADGKNVIWDITMSSLESTEKRIDDLREFGYSRVEAIFVDIPVATSIQRADARHREDHDSYRAGEGLGGRYIAPEIIRAQADPDWGSLNRRTFEQVKPKVDAWRQYDNSVRGRAAQLVDSGGREEDRV
jgi:predicted kinase